MFGDVHSLAGVEERAGGRPAAKQLHETSLESPFFRKGAAMGGGPQDSSEVASGVVAPPTTTVWNSKGRWKEGASTLEWATCTSRTAVCQTERVQVLLEAMALRIPGEHLKGRQVLGSAGKAKTLKGREAPGAWGWREHNGQHSQVQGGQGMTSTDQC